MKEKFDFKKFTPHILAIVGFIVIISIYFSPVFEGKGLSQHDVKQAHGMGREVFDHYKETGEIALWTNTMFSGMPAYQIWIRYPNNVASYLISYIKLRLPDPLGYFFLYFIGFYILLLVFKVKPLLAFAGGVAFAFSSYNLILLEAGHTNKALAIGIVPIVLSGVILILRGKYIFGGILAALALSMEIRANHFQITYYLMIIILILIIVEFVHVVKNKEYATFIKSMVVLFFASVLSLGVNASSLWSNYEYAKYTMRGGSDLTEKQVDGGGLEKNYALSWSYGKFESMTLLIPGFSGGASYESLGTSSNTYKLLLDKKVPKKNAINYVKQLPLYWGAMGSTSGPVYFGAIICYLFVLGLFLIKGRLKWWLLVVTVLSISLAMGKNFPQLTNLFFNYFPMYNKFRVPMTLLVMASVAMPLLAIYVLNEITSGNLEKQYVLKSLKNSLYIVGGIILFFIIFCSSLFSFSAIGDTALENSENAWLLEGLLADRARMLRLDGLRSIVFILIVSGALFFFVKEKLQLKYLLVIVCVAVLIDLWGVDKRYFNQDDFSRQRRGKKTLISRTAADDEILQDPDPNFKVLNLSLNPWTDATTSYFHKSIGGYHGAKLARYQDLIEYHLSPEITVIGEGLRKTGQVLFENTPVLNMLNTKYYIIPVKDGNRVILNPGMLGNAWFVKDYKYVNNADEEIEALKNLNPKDSVIVDKRFSDLLKGFEPKADTSSRIELIEYNPNFLIYNYESNSEQLTVFSEIYYEDGWNAYIDGKEVPHFRVNYILRALIIPAGKHEIKFEFKPKSFYSGEKISLACSALLVLVLIGGIAMETKKKKGLPKHEAREEKT